MNRAQIRDAVFAQLDWAPSQGTNAISRVNEFIQRAVDLLSMEAPFLFHEKTVHIWSEADLTKNDTTDTVGVRAGDAWVITKDLATGATQTAWPIDETLNGRWIEIKDGNGIWRRRQIRDSWSGTKGGVSTHYQISLMTPWPNTTENTGLDWRIYTPDYPLPHDVIEPHTIRIWSPNKFTEAPLTILDQTEAEDWHLVDSPQNNVEGAPRAAVRRKQEAPIPAPQEAPIFGAGVKINWANTINDELPGSFSYKITYAWGIRDVETTSAQLSIREPRWESPPSPSSSVVTVEVGDTVPQLLLPNLDFMQGFGDASSSRYQHSGFYVRIWRRRHSFDDSSAVNPNRQRSEVSDAYFLVGTSPGFAGQWSDQATTADYLRRLTDIHSYQTVALYPRPDDRYEMTIRCIHRPPKLEDDSDAPLVYPETINIVIDRVLAFVYEMQGNNVGAGLATQRYEKGLRLLAKRFASLRPADRPIRKLPARRTVSRSWRERNARRWYRLPDS